MPDLIQTVHVADSWLARPKKLTERKKRNKEKNYKMKIKNEKTLMGIRARKKGAVESPDFHCSTSSASFMIKNEKTKKCQPAASNMPDLIQTVHVADSWLARPKKLTERKKRNKEKKL